MQIIFSSGTKYLWLAQYVKKCVRTQNILGPVKGQGIKKSKQIISVVNTNLPLQFTFRDQMK